MNALALLVVLDAALVWVGGWASVRAAAALDARPLPPRLRARLTWWSAHRPGVGAACAALAAGGITAGLLAG